TLGVVDTNDPTEDRDLLPSYRNDLFERLLADGAWIDFVGDFQNGPADMLDADNSGNPGERFGIIAHPSPAISILADDLSQHAPDVVVLMAGTNDFSGNEAVFFDKHHGQIVQSVRNAVDIFYDDPANASNHLVISGVPPKLRNGAPAELSEFLNEGYSMVNGEPVAGDAGNGSFVPGIADVVAELQATRPTLHYFDNPMTAADVTSDGVHFTQAAYDRYAEDLNALLQSEVGVTAGTLDGTAQSVSGNVAIGGAAGDLIVGSASADTLSGGGGNDVLKGEGGGDTLSGDAGMDRIEGGAGVDVATGGLGDDSFVFGTDFAAGVGGGQRDAITDFGMGSDRLIFDDDFAGLVTVTDGVGNAVVISAAGPSGGEVLVEGAAAQSLKGAALGGGVFEITDDDALFIFAPNTDQLIG
ncbi:MAG: SGNH/GDSL hydrolase family protein, partial [Pseudomonadota bacterium]